jgi:hypothetical protein
MTNTPLYLIDLLDHQPNSPWASELRDVLQSPELGANQIPVQHCTVHFALGQAKRRLESSRQLKKRRSG